MQETRPEDLSPAAAEERNELRRELFQTEMAEKMDDRLDDLDGEVLHKRYPVSTTAAQAVHLIDAIQSAENRAKKRRLKSDLRALIKNL